MHCTQETLFIQNNPSSRWIHLSLRRVRAPQRQVFLFGNRFTQELINEVR